jgi:hypothetical protein
MNDHETVERADRAKRELELTSESFEKLRAKMVEELIACPVGQDLKIAKLHMGLQMIDAVRKSLVDMVINGTVAAHAIAAQNLLRP